MRYFSQLARETKARVIPARQPPWLPPIAQVVQENVAEWPSETSVIGTDSKAGQAPRGQEVSTDRLVRHRESADPSADMNPAPRPSSFKSEEWRPEGPRERVVIEKHLHQELVPMPQVRNSGAAHELLPVGHPQTPDHHESGISRTVVPAQPVEQIAPADQQIKRATLQDVISEITRRQEEFERNDRAKGASIGIGPSTETARAEARRERKTEGVSLNIGSIVVQVAPEPPSPKAPPRTAARRSSQESDHRWKRSFLDRY
jgi:hypothetical protein